MKLTLFIILLTSLLFFPVSAQQNPNNQKPNIDVQKIVASFTAKETEFRLALNNYQFKRDALVQRIGSGGLGLQITGEYHRVSSFVFDDKGKRYEKIINFPPPWPEEMNSIVTPEDLD